MRSDSAVRLVRRSETAPRPREWGADVRTLFAGGAEGVPGQKHAGNTVGEHAGNEVGERGGNEVGEHAGNKVGEHVGSRVGEHAENKVGKHARNRVGWRPWQVLGGPGTGKTALLIDVAVDRIAAGADPESVLVLTHSKAAALRVRGAVTRQLSASIGGVPGATREPLVRTVHSYAFALLRTHAAAHGNPPPRLLTGTEQDVVLREMLRGEVEDIARGAEELWPQRLQPGLGTVGFAEQLRDLMLRATERGLGPEDLVELGRLHDRPEWEAAGRFAERYEQAMLLRWSVGVEAPEASAPALDAAELVGAALDALALDPRLLDGERDRIRYLLVDDAQHLDPLAAQLIRAIGGGAATVVIAGDPDQAVFTFRGADSRFAADPDAPHERRIILRDNHRCAPAVREAVARVAARLPGSFPHRSQVGAPDENDGAGVDFAVRVLTTPAKEAALIADRLRRAHLTDGVPWSRMAVVVRSVPLSLAPLRRALLAAGVPVLQPKPDVPLARRRGASWMLLTLRALLSGERGGAEIIGSTTFTADDALDLLSGPLGGADQISLRRLRRGIRRTLLERGRGSAETDPRDGGDTPTDADRHDETADRRARRSSALDRRARRSAVSSCRSASVGVSPPSRGSVSAEPRPRSSRVRRMPRRRRRRLIWSAPPSGPESRSRASSAVKVVEPMISAPPRSPDSRARRVSSIQDAPRRRASGTSGFGCSTGTPAASRARRSGASDSGTERTTTAIRDHGTPSVRWARMAVVVRSVPLSLAPLRRALLAAGVPVLQPKPDVPLARRRGASWMLLTLRALLSGERGGAEIIGSTTFTADDALDLLSGPLGGADQISLRRLRRGIRRTLLERGRGSAETDPRDGGDTPTDADRHDETADRRARRSSALDDEFGVDTVDSARFADLDRSSAEVLRDLIAGVGDFTILDRLTEVEAAPLRRVLKAIGRARRARTRGAGLEDVLWALWTASRLEKRWVGQSERGGAVGMQADRDLDAAVGLFDAAAAYVDRLPRATVEGFVEYLEQQEIPQDSAPLTDSGDAVAIVSAHAAAGREWDVVAIAGVQEGIWPNLRPRGTLLGVEDLVDLMAGVADPGEQVSRAAPILAEERRLLLLACSRARRSLLVTAVESVSGDRDLVPSRFLAELDPTAEPGEPGRIPPPIDPGRALVMQALIAELRGVACDPEDVPVRRERAARQLARLARAGVRGAHPDDWYGTAAPSSQLPLWGDEEGPVALSPSTVELLKTCPLRWALERHGGSDGDNPHAVKGNLVHTLVQALAGQVTEAQVKAALVRAWKAIDPASGDTGPQSWHSRQELRRTESMLDTFLAWLRNTRDELTQMGVEVPVDCVLPARDPDEYPVRIRGRVDRVERDALGRFVIVDVKTGKTPISKQAAQDHAQLATYQVAAAAGALDDDSPAATPGGARLIYVAKPNTREGATQRLQPPLDPEALTEWRTTIHTAATSTRGPSYLAMRNDGCRHCPVSTSCPVQDTGRQVTDE
ncbi:PD-(D/E)XK nuclease family protein [Nocardia terpenica]|uniref:PD-(D/E)XK nuclease family protein n=1 Tax=Nocardia terpenica TaxID=455432 RepID=UPI001E32309D|nr:PD-(D/E)XK nuclease family protein [Nocardia terpenica]